MSKRIFSSLRGYLLIVLGVFSAAFGLKSFVLPNGFIDGGVTGISLLLADITHLPLSLLIVLINIPFFFLAWKQIHRSFAIKTVCAIVCLGVALIIVDFGTVTEDKLLVAVFGGFFIGMGVGLCIRGGSVIDGTEVLALYIDRKSGLTIGDAILLINVVIFGFAALRLGLEPALYSILTYLAASKTVEFVVNGIEEYTGVTIVSAKSEEIREAIIRHMGHGVTIYNGKRGYGKRGETQEIDIVYTVITRLEVSRLKSEIEKIDEQAFVVMHSINDIRGGIVKKRSLQ